MLFLSISCSAQYVFMDLNPPTMVILEGDNPHFRVVSKSAHRPIQESACVPPTLGDKKCKSASSDLALYQWDTWTWSLFQASRICDTRRKWVKNLFKCSAYSVNPYWRTVFCNLNTPGTYKVYIAFNPVPPGMTCTYMSYPK